jgi:hypothetical protein
MDDNTNIKVNLKDYYSSNNKNLSNSIYSNNNIKNLIYLSSQMDINPFNKKNKKWELKTKEKIIKECEQVKKKKLKDFSSILSNLAKIGSNNTTEVKSIYKSFENKLDNIDKIITCATYINTPLQKVNSIVEPKVNSIVEPKVNLIVEPKVNLIVEPTQKNTYIIEHEPNSQSNIVSFDIVGFTNIKQKKNKKSENYQDIKTIEINNDKIKKNIKILSESDDYLECFSNC